MRRYLRVSFWLIRLSLALMVLCTLACLWAVQLVVFLPLLIWASLCRDKKFAFAEPAPVPSGYAPESIVFDRLLDASKLYGCNTRNVPFRWAIFLSALEFVKASRPDDELPRALDFGAGSMRDSYELARMGFQVTSSDLNERAMQEGLKFYDWNSVAHTPECVSGPLGTALGESSFHVITSFDVIEHLFEPVVVLDHLRRHLAADGMMLITVPNRRTLGERIGRFRHWLRMRRGKPDYSGVPHVQFRTPGEWRTFFESVGFKVHAHDMAIGALVNDGWASFYGLPVRIFIEPVIRQAAVIFGFSYTKFRFEQIFYPAWLMRLVNRLDESFKPWLRGQWAWNLFVLQKP